MNIKTAIDLYVKESEDEIEFKEIVKDIISNKTVQKMKDIPQHYSSNCFDHCCKVSYYCYKICKKFNLDYVSAARAGMLHDLYLYNWRDKSIKREGPHAFTHGRIACRNACKEFDLNEKEKDMIIKHMWPLTIALPKSIEGFILTFVDKFCALQENIDFISNRKFMRYAYLLLCIFFLRIK